MEEVYKTFDINKMFDEVEKTFEEYKSLGYVDFLDEKRKVINAMSTKVVSGLYNILKNDSIIPNSKVVNRVCKFVDKINSESNAMWGFTTQEKDVEILISFLKELVVKGCLSQIKDIFWSGESNYPLVTRLSSEYEIKDKFYELFDMLPEDYQNDLLGETIYYSENDIDFSVSLIGGASEILG